MIESLNTAMLELQSALTARSLYPASHPRIRNSEAQAYRLLREVTAGCGEVTSPMYDADLEGAHKHSSMHRDEIERSDSCGCFYCLSVFGPDEIDEWVDDDSGRGVTALCPRCVRAAASTR